MKKVKFNIQGMTCSSCSSHVERAVNKLDGVKCVNVNLLSNNMIVEYEDNKLDDNNIIKAVIEAGYGANVEERKKTREKKEETIDNKDVIKSMKKRLIVSICFLIPLMYIAMYHMIYEWMGIPIPQFMEKLFHGNANAITFGFTQFLLVIPIIYVNRNYFKVGIKRIFKLTPNMDSLISIGSGAAILYGIFAIFMIGYGLGHNNMDIVERYSMDIYFESAGTILTLITFGKYLETKSKGKTSDAISKLINLVPRKAIVLREGKEIEISLDEIIVGDLIIIRPGESIGVDGIIIEGNSSIDESSITGESMPIEKAIGDNVVSGTINKNGALKVKATKVGNDTTLSQIIKLVEEASNSKAPIARLADNVSGVFVPIVIIIAILATLYWLFMGQSFEFALSIGIAVLVISCPCALGLATPVAIMVGTGKGAEHGILIKSAESLELLHSVNTVVLDKTGTVTVGKPKVTDIVLSDIRTDNCKSMNQMQTQHEQKIELLKIAGSLEKNSEHPLADAIMKKAEESRVDLVDVKDFIAIPGRGVKGKIEGRDYFGGNILFMKENNIHISKITKKSDKLLKQAKTVLYFANENEVIGIIAVADTIKETSLQAIQEMKKRNIEVVMLTGDNRVVAEQIGKQLEIDKVISEVLPQEKESEVLKLQEQGKKVAFVGDGINDSPALVRADVGLAIGSGTDIAIESADIILMKDTLLDVVTAISLSKAVIRNIKMNLFWAFFYNCVGIPIAAGVFYLSFGFKLSPMIGAAAMSLSSVCVVTNALTLRRFKTNFKFDLNFDKDVEIQSKNNIKEKNNMHIKNISVEGMQCEHCKMSVEKALKNIDGVVNVDVNLESKVVNIESIREIDNNEIKIVIENVGFTVIF